MTAERTPMAIGWRVWGLGVMALAMVALAVFSIDYAQDRPSAIKESLKWLELLLALLIFYGLLFCSCDTCASCSHRIFYAAEPPLARFQIICRM